MELANVGEALTRKYGPLPGYAWAGIGALGLVVILRHSSSSGSSSSPAFLTTPPQSGVTSPDSGGGGGGGGFDTGSDGGTTGDTPPSIIDVTPPPAPASADPHITTATTAPPYDANLPVPTLPAYAPIPGTSSHPGSVGGGAPILNTPPGSNIHRPGLQLE